MKIARGELFTLRYRCCQGGAVSLRAVTESLQLKLIQESISRSCEKGPCGCQGRRCAVALYIAFILLGSGTCVQGTGKKKRLCICSLRCEWRFKTMVISKALLRKSIQVCRVPQAHYEALHARLPGCVRPPPLPALPSGGERVLPSTLLHARSTCHLIEFFVTVEGLRMPPGALVARETAGEVVIHRM